MENNKNLYNIDIRNLHINPLTDIENISQKMENLKEKIKFGLNVNANKKELADLDQVLLKATRLDLHDYFYDNHTPDDIDEWNEGEFEPNEIKTIRNEWSDGSKVLYRIDLDSCLYKYLLDWYGHPQFSEKQVYNNMKRNIRGCYIDHNQYGFGLYFITEIGYDSIDKDLLSGTGDGQTREFFTNYFVYGQHQVNHPGAKTRNKWMQLEEN